MKLNTRSFTIFVLGTMILAPSCVFASDLSKVGKAIAYPIRKTATNASIDTHRALGHNSVERRHLRRHRRRNVVITSGGHVKPVHHH